MPSVLSSEKTTLPVRLLFFRVEFPTGNVPSVYVLLSEHHVFTHSRGFTGEVDPVRIKKRVRNLSLHTLVDVSIQQKAQTVPQQAIG